MSLQAILTDIEGTTSSLAFVRESLFPYARSRMPAWLAAFPGQPEVLAACAAALEQAPAADPAGTLQQWIDQDRKHPALKALQGRIWRDGYAQGELKGHLWPDAARGLKQWAASGLRLAVFSSGSTEAQQLLFRHSIEGDLTALFCGWFDTRSGGKREAAAYRTIAGALGLPAADILFLSDVVEELDAARLAGLRTCCIERGEDGWPAPHRHARAVDFSGVSLSD